MLVLMESRQKMTFVAIALNERVGCVTVLELDKNCQKTKQWLSRLNFNQVY